MSQNTNPEVRSEQGPPEEPSRDHRRHTKLTGLQDGNQDAVQPFSTVALLLDLPNPFQDDGLALKQGVERR